MHTSLHFPSRQLGGHTPSLQPVWKIGFGSGHSSSSRCSSSYSLVLRLQITVLCCRPPPHVALHRFHFDTYHSAGHGCALHVWIISSGLTSLLQKCSGTDFLLSTRWHSVNLRWYPPAQISEQLFQLPCDHWYISYSDGSRTTSVKYDIFNDTTLSFANT